MVCALCSVRDAGRVMWGVVLRVCIVVCYRLLVFCCVFVLRVACFEICVSCVWRVLCASRGVYGV